MWSGVSALNNLDQALQTIRNDVVRLDSQLSQLTGELGTYQRQRVATINRIAKVRLEAIEQDRLQSSFNAADDQANRLLQQREQALVELNQSIEVLNQQIEDSEKQRESLLQKQNQTVQEVVEEEAKVQAGLEQDSDYMAQFEQAKQINSVAVEAERKALQAQQDLAEKALPYQADKVFMYLWKRHYGTADYQANFLTRYLDSWAAGLVNYEENRTNYWNLQEIPKRLEEHAQRVAQQADEAQMALQQLELDALEQAGVKTLETKLDMIREQLDQQDDVLEQQETELNTQLDQRTRYLSGQDDYIQRAIAALSQALQHRELDTIHRYVRDTISPTDDKLVIELQQLDDRLDDIEDGLTDVRILHEKKLYRLKELEQVRRNFKHNRFDDVRSSFGNEAILAGVLNEFLQGVVSGSDLWRVWQRNQRYRRSSQQSLPDFGSGGLGDLLGDGQRRRGNSSWHWPKPRRGGGGFRIPSSRSRRSSGGFRTGGGF